MYSSVHKTSQLAPERKLPRVTRPRGERDTPPPRQIYACEHNRLGTRSNIFEDFFDPETTANEYLAAVEQQLCLN